MKVWPRHDFGNFLLLDTKVCIPPVAGPKSKGVYLELSRTFGSFFVPDAKTTVKPM